MLGLALFYIYGIMATIFSRIIAGEIPCYKVAENEKLFSNPKLKLADEEFVAIAKTINSAYEAAQ